MQGSESVIKQHLDKLLKIKDSDIRVSMLYQAYTAVDQGIHAGGALSAVVPLVSLFYGNVMDYDIKQPTRIDKDRFILSKGHAVAALASIMADLGYFEKTMLGNSH